MAEPATSTAAAAATFKLWTLLASVTGSLIPLLALSDKRKISIKNAAISAAVGASFAIFVGPLIAQKLDLISSEGTLALSWVMGGTGVYIVRAVIFWLEEKGPFAIDKIVNKLIDTLPGDDEKEEEKVEVILNTPDEHKEMNSTHIFVEYEENRGKSDYYKT